MPRVLPTDLRVTTQDKSHVLLDLTVVLWLCNPALKSLLHAVLSPFGVQGMTMLAAGVITYLPLLLYFLQKRQIPSKIFIWLYIVVALFFMVTVALNPAYSNWYSRDIFGVSYTIFRPDHGALWAVLMVELSQTPQRLWNNLKTTAIVTMVYNLYVALGAYQRGYWTYINSAGQVDQRSYDLDFGYNMIFAAIVFMAWAIWEKRWVALIPSGISMLLVFWQGSRGALICLVAFSVLVFAVPRGRRSTYVLKLAIAAGVGAWFYASWQWILLRVAETLTSFGVESRTLNSILENEILDSTGRDGIYALVSQALLSNPLGYGAYGDRPIVGPQYNWGYSHNIYYEMAMNFGVVFASAMLAIIAITVLRRIVTSRDKYLQICMIIVVSMSMRLLVSDTFWGNNFFWLAIGMIFAMRPDGQHQPGTFSPAKYEKGFTKS